MDDLFFGIQPAGMLIIGILSIIGWIIINAIINRTAMGISTSYHENKASFDRKGFALLMLIIGFLMMWFSVDLAIMFSAEVLDIMILAGVILFLGFILLIKS